VSPAALLWPLCLTYRGLVATRAAAYRRGWLATHRAGVPVVAVGNLTVGGSGKTPVVDYLLRLATARGVPAAVLTRGHGRRTGSHLSRVRWADTPAADATAVGDEPLMLARRHPAVPVYVGPDRVAAARLAAVVDAPRLLVADDAFQHLRLARDLNLLLVDAERGLGNERVLPCGPLREPPGAIHRADAVLITKANLGDADAVAQRLTARWGFRGPVFRSAFLPAALERLDGAAALPPEALAGREVGLVCGIAQPAGFAAVVAALGGRVARERTFPDHHPYAPADLERLATEAAGADPAAPAWVTTEKDAVKLRDRFPRPDRLWVLRMEARPESAAEAFFIDFMGKTFVT